MNKLDTSKRLFTHYFRMAIPGFDKDPDLVVEIREAVDFLYQAAVEEARAQLQQEINFLQSQIDDHDKDIYSLFNPNP